MANVHEDVAYRVAATTDEFAAAKELFMEYARSLDIDLGFQGFDDELNTIDSQYGKPSGALLIAYKDNRAVGCAGIRRLDEDTAELKRMFVQEEYRRFKIGRKLLELAINVARDLNYKRVRLDTLPGMASAQSLYRSFGFYEIPPYRFNPVREALYMEKRLD